MVIDTKKKNLQQVRKYDIELDRLNREERILVNSIGILGDQVDMIGAYASELALSDKPTSEKILPPERLRDINMLVQTMVKVVELQNKIMLWKREQLGKMTSGELLRYLADRGIDDLSIKT